MGFSLANIIIGHFTFVSEPTAAFFHPPSGRFGIQYTLSYDNTLNISREKI